MKKFLAGLVVLFVFMVSVPLTAEAHNGCRKHYSSKRYKNRSNYRNTSRYAYNNSYNRRGYSTNGYAYERPPSFYQRHRNLINVGVGTGAGALIGGLTKGKKGALVGSLIGAGGGALYTYVLNPKKKRYVRR
jgi:hypothetical protein